MALAAWQRARARAGTQTANTPTKQQNVTPANQTSATAGTDKSTGHVLCHECYQSCTTKVATVFMGIRILSESADYNGILDLYDSVASDSNLHILTDSEVIMDSVCQASGALGKWQLCTDTYAHMKRKSLNIWEGTYAYIFSAYEELGQWDMIEPLRTEMTSRSFFLSSDSERIVTLSRDKLRQAGDDHGVPGSVNTTSSHTMSMKLCFILLGGIMIRSWAPPLHLIADVFFLRLAWQYYSLRRPRPSPVWCAGWSGSS